MKTLETLPPEPAEALYHRTVLNENRINASVLYLDPGQQVESQAAVRADEAMLFVMQGRATVRFDELNHVLNQEQALHLSRNQSVTVWNDGPAPTRLLRVNLRLPRPGPAVVTMPRG